MMNHYLDEKLAEMRREEAMARAEHARMLAENGLDLLSVLRRSVDLALARLRSALVRPAPADLRLVSRAQLERRVHRAA